MVLIKSQFFDVIDLIIDPISRFLELGLMSSSKFSAREQIDAQVPAGQYYLGDPCYVVPNDDWTDFCQIIQDQITYIDKSCNDHSSLQAIYYQDTKIIFWCTAYGDGKYPVYGEQNGFCSVDAGLLSLIPVNQVLTWKNSISEMKKFAMVIKLDHTVTLEMTSLGNVSIGDDCDIITNQREDPDREEHLEQTIQRTSRDLLEAKLLLSKCKKAINQNNHPELSVEINQFLQN